MDGNNNPLANTAQGNFSYNTANAAGHLHAVSSVGSGSTSYSATYDAAGNMTCRAIGSLSCTTTGSPTGQLLGYDALRRLISWQNATTSPTATSAFRSPSPGGTPWRENR